MVFSLPKSIKLISSGILLSSLFVAQSSQAQCVPTFTDGCDLGDYINSFSLSGDDGTSISHSLSGCSSGSYDDATSSMPPITLTESSSYTATISSMYYNPSIGEGDYVAIWIDLNNDGVFTVDERVAAYSSFILPTGSSVPLSIPSGITPGTYTMRVMLGLNLNADYLPVTAADFDPCNVGPNTLNYGEVHDYSVSLINAPLPVNLISFTGTALREGNIQLDWNTDSENSNKGFTIMKSFDGKKFDKLTWTPTKSVEGNSHNQLAYQFIDQKSNNSNVVFYKLLQEDNNGRTSESKVIRVDLKTVVKNVTVAPNPTKNQIIVNGPEQFSTNAKIIMSDVTGSIIQEINVNSASTLIDMSNMNGGLYIINYVDNDFTQTIKVTKI